MSDFFFICFGGKRLPCLAASHKNSDQSDFQAVCVFWGRDDLLTVKTELSVDASAPCNSEPTCVDAELICHISRPPRRPATHQIRWEMRSDWLRASSNAWALAHPHPSSPSCGCVLPSQLDSDVMVWTCSHSFPTAGSETLAHPRWKTFPVSKTLLQDKSPRWVRPAV